MFHNGSHYTHAHQHAHRPVLQDTVHLIIISFQSYCWFVQKRQAFLNVLQWFFLFSTENIVLISTIRLCICSRPYLLNICIDIIAIYTCLFTTIPPLCHFQIIHRNWLKCQLSQHMMSWFSHSASHQSTNIVSSCSAFRSFVAYEREHGIKTHIATGTMSSRKYAAGISLLHIAILPIIYDFWVDRQISCATFWKLYKSAPALYVILFGIRFNNNNQKIERFTTHDAQMAKRGKIGNKSSKMLCPE